MRWTKQYIYLVYEKYEILFPVPIESFRSVFQKNYTYISSTMNIKGSERIKFYFIVIGYQNNKIYLFIFFNYRKLIKVTDTGIKRRAKTNKNP